MRRLFSVLLLAVSCKSPEAPRAPAARWEIDPNANLAVSLCPRCVQPVARDGTKCAGCGAAYHIEPKTIDCPQCERGTAFSPCEGCEGTGKCAICDGAGTFEGRICPECDGRKACPDCAGREAPANHVCENCGGTGKIELE